MTTTSHFPLPVCVYDRLFRPVGPEGVDEHTARELLRRHVGHLRREEAVL